jgi:hypothetical protein
LIKSLGPKRFRHWSGRTLRAALQRLGRMIRAARLHLRLAALARYRPPERFLAPYFFIETTCAGTLLRVRASSTRSVFLIILAETAARLRTLAYARHA